MKATPAPSKQPKKAAPKHLTWEHPQGSGIKIAEMPNKTGGKVFGFSYQIRVPAELLGVVGKREMIQKKTKAEAERTAEDRFIALRQHGTEFAKIPADAQKQAAIAWGILNEHNKKSGTALNLIDTINAGIRALCPTGGKRTIKQVIDELHASKKARHENGGLDSSTLHDFATRSARIEKAMGTRYVGEITHTELAQWLAEQAKNGAQFGGPLSSRSIRNYRSTLREVFNYAYAKQYCADDPFARFTREDFKSLGGEGTDRNLDDVNALTVDEARCLVEAARASTETGMLASTVLRLFCGVRTTEVTLLDWSEVHWLEERPYIHIPAGKAKKRRIRHVEIPENALAWLKLCNPPKAGQIIPGTGDKRKDTKTYCVKFGRVTEAAGIGAENEEGDWESDWESNDTRHSFGSYHYALHGDAMRTAGQMGHKNNDDVLFAHYRQLVTKEKATEFFGLLPAKAASNVTDFPQAASA